MNLNKIEKMFVRDFSSAEIIRNNAQPLVDNQTDVKMNLNKVEKLCVRDITSVELRKKKSEPLIENQNYENSNEVPDLTKMYFRGNSSEMFRNQYESLKNARNVERELSADKTRVIEEQGSPKNQNIEKTLARGLTSYEIIRSQRESSITDYQREASKMSIELDNMLKSLPGIIPDDDNKKTEKKRKSKRFKNRVLPPLKAQPMSNQVSDEIQSLILVKESTQIVKCSSEFDPDSNFLVALPSSTQIPFLQNSQDIFGQKMQSFVRFKFSI